MSSDLSSLPRLPGTVTHDDLYVTRVKALATGGFAVTIIEPNIVKKHGRVLTTAWCKNTHQVKAVIDHVFGTPNTMQPHSVRLRADCPICRLIAENSGYTAREDPDSANVRRWTAPNAKTQAARLAKAATSHD